jgi:alanine racemase
VTASPLRWAWAEIDLGALAHNVGVLQAVAEPSALWAVVKADAYGHGAVQVARVALQAGATGLCVALVQEGVELRAAGVAGPILVLSEQPAEQLDALLDSLLTPTLYSVEGIAAVAAGVADRSPEWREAQCPYPVQLKLDTGMRRVGAPLAALPALLEAVQATAGLLAVEAVFTHLAVADEPSRTESASQLTSFDQALTGVWEGVTHAANSAGLLVHPAARRDIVRAGIAMYGLPPGPQLASWATALRPVLSLKARVSFVKRLAAGTSLSYGLRHTLASAATIATVPIGYADGVPRRLFAAGAEVLIGGERRVIAGTVTMDQIMVDCGDDTVTVGDEVVLIGKQGDLEITATEWAERLGTINYEIVCGISHRVPRIYLAG